MKDLNSLAVQRVLYFIIIVNILSNCIFLYDIYRPHNVDDAGLMFFRKTGAFFYGYILNIVGWDYGKAQLLSALLMVSSGWFWFLALKKLHFKPAERTAFLMLFFYMEFSFAAATSLRYESLILFFQSAAILLLLQKKYFLVGLISSIAVETHPIGVLNLAYLIGIMASSYAHIHSSDFTHRLKVNQREIIYFFLGCIVGVAYYFYLHPLSLTSLYQFLYLNSIQGVGEHYDTKLGILGLYFFSTKYLRHIPELIIIIVALYLFISNQIYKNRLFVLIWVLLLIVLSILRPVFTYSAIIFPAFIVLIVSSSQAIRKLNLLLLIFVCLTEVKSFVPADGLPVIGSAMSWFALKERKTFKSGVYPFYRLKQPEWKEAYLVEDEFYRNEDVYRGAKDYFSKNYRFSTIKTSNLTGKPIVLKKLTQK